MMENNQSSQNRPEVPHTKITQSKLPFPKPYLKWLLLVVLIVVTLYGIFYFYTNSVKQKPMVMKPVTQLCDLNENGTCEQDDFALFMQAFGKKRGDPDYNPLADADADGIVSDIDATMLQFPFPITLPKSTTTPTPNLNQVACTQDVKECPDGSFVARQPPSCEFAPCPN